jgi:hypothetical protein
MSILRFPKADIPYTYKECLSWDFLKQTSLIHTRNDLFLSQDFLKQTSLIRTRNELFLSQDFLKQTILIRTRNELFLMWGPLQQTLHVLTRNDLFLTWGFQKQTSLSSKNHCPLRQIRCPRNDQKINLIYNLRKQVAVLSLRSYISYIPQITH